jgi:hypothetical protein
MRGPVIGNNPRKRIYYEACVDHIFVAVVTDQITGEALPAIYLDYPEIVRPTVLEIVKEMDAAGCQPTLHILDGTELCALFVLRPVSRSLMNEHLVAALPALAPHVSSLPRDTELVMTGEADVNASNMSTFMKMFREHRRFLLCIVERNGDDFTLTWTKELRSFTTTIPHLR